MIEAMYRYISDRWTTDKRWQMAKPMVIEIMIFTSVVMESVCMFARDFSLLPYALPMIKFGSILGQQKMVSKLCIVDFQCDWLEKLMS